MDRNDARKAAEVMLAYADGKEIEWCQKGCNDDWRSIVTAHFDWDSNCYRVKPEPKCRPFKDAEECWREMQKHQPFGWIAKGKRLYAIKAVECNTVFIDDGCENRSLIAFFNDGFTFADGEPFGVKEEENEE